MVLFRACQPKGPLQIQNHVWAGIVQHLTGICSENKLRVVSSLGRFVFCLTTHPFYEHYGACLRESTHTLNSLLCAVCQMSESQCTLPLTGHGASDDAGLTDWSSDIYSDLPLNGTQQLVLREKSLLHPCPQAAGLNTQPMKSLPFMECWSLMSVGQKESHFPWPAGQENSSCCSYCAGAPREPFFPEALPEGKRVSHVTLWNVDKFTQPNPPSLPPFWNNCHQKAWFTLLSKQRAGQKGAKTGLVDGFTKLGASLAEVSGSRGSTHVPGSGSFLCVLRMHSRIQTGARFGVLL